MESGTAKANVGLEKQRALLHDNDHQMLWHSRGQPEWNATL